MNELGVNCSLDHIAIALLSNEDASLNNTFNLTHYKLLVNFEDFLETKLFSKCKDFEIPFKYMIIYKKFIDFNEINFDNSESYLEVNSCFSSYL